MAKFCPITGDYTVYLTCQECDEKLCRLPHTKTLWVDMDGTIARFYEHSDCLERMHEEGFFLNLREYADIVNVLICLDPVVDIRIISAIHPNVWNQVVTEKHSWLKKVGLDLPREKVLFVPVGANKAEAARDALGRELTPLDVLLDDYNKNLEEWESLGGLGIKFVNEINDKGEIGPLWQGLRIYHDKPEESAKMLLLRKDTTL